jgi:tetratricopeptide (TPR) repeat protein
MATREHGRFFVGREPELAKLEAALHDALSGRAGLILLEGEVGIGKTCVAEELTRAAENADASVLWGRCWEGDGAPAFWPWVQILRALGEQFEIPRDLLAGPAGAAAQLVPELIPKGEAPSEPLALEPEHARFRLFDGVALLLTKLARRRPLLLVVDDLHWADRSSLLLLHFLARELREARILMVATYRRDHAAHAAALQDMLSRLVREGTHLVLGGLARHDVARFVATATGTAPPPELVTALHERTEGNPFFMGEMVRLLAADGRIVDGADASALRRIMPDNVRHTVRRGLDLLEPATRRVLRSASAIGCAFETHLLLAVERAGAHADESPRDAVLRALEAAVAARIVVAPSEGDLHRFSHVLIRDVLYEELPREERIDLHRRIAEGMEERHATDLEPVLSELAHHFAAGEADPKKVVGYTRRAAERAADILAFEEAAQLVIRALDALDDWQATIAKDDVAMRSEIESIRCATLLTLGAAQAQAGETPRARRTYLDAAAVARRLGDRPALARAALGAAGRGDVLTGPDREVERLLAEAILALEGEEGALHARLLGRLAMALYFADDRERCVELSERALAMAERLGDRSAIAFCLVSRHMALLGPDHVLERKRIADRIVTLAERGGTKEALAGGYLWRIIDQLELADVPAVDLDLARYVRLATELRLPFLLWQAAALRAMRAQLGGRLDEAEALADATLDLGRRARSPNAELLHAVQIIVLRREQGRLDEIEPLLRALAEEYPALPAFRTGLAMIHAELGREAAARTQFETLAADDFTAIPGDANWLNALGELAQTCAFLGDTARARLLYDRLAPYAGRNVVIGFAEAIDGSVARYLGLLARTLGRFEEAAAHFHDAIARNERMGALGQAAHARRELAEMHLRRDADGDAATGATLRDEAIAAYARLGMDRFAERALALGAPAGPSVRAAPAEGGAPPAPGGARPGAISPGRIFRREGDFWTIGDEVDVVRLKDSKGLRYIAHLLGRPGQAQHVIDLVALVDRGPVVAGPPTGLPGLDREARAAYRRRRIDLDQELAEAEGYNDLARTETLRAEIEFLERELTAGYGLGGRPRVTGEPVERLRKAVSNRVRDAIEHVSRVHPALGSHLAHSVRTGIFCEYRPELASEWRL